MVEFPYKSSTEVPKHHSKHIPAASVANASGSLQTPLSELTRRSDFHLFYRDYCPASLPIECWSLNGSRWRDGRFAYVKGRVHVLAETALPCSATGCRIMSVLRRSSPPARWDSRKNAVPKYQNTIQNTYQPRPSQTPAAPFKRLYPN